MTKIIIFLAALCIFSASVTLAAPCAPGSSTTGSNGTVTLCNPVERPGTIPGTNQNTPIATNIVEFGTKIIFIMAGFATLLPIIAVAYSGFSMIIANGNEETISRAKLSLTWAVAGFIIAILSFVIIMILINLTGASKIPDPLAPSSAEVQNPLTTDAFGVFIVDFLNRVLSVAGLVAIVSIIISGFRYITSAGNEEQAKHAKTGLTWSVAGIITILFSYVIIKAAAAIFGIS